MFAGECTEKKSEAWKFFPAEMRQLHIAELKNIKNKHNENTEGRKWARQHNQHK
jgi:hypothetical protein